MKKLIASALVVVTAATVAFACLSRTSDAPTTTAKPQPAQLSSIGSCEPTPKPVCE